MHKLLYHPIFFTSTLSGRDLNIGFNPLFLPFDVESYQRSHQEITTRHATYHSRVVVKKIKKINKQWSHELVSPLKFLPHIVNMEHGDTWTTQAPIMIGNRAGTGETPQLSFTESLCCWNKLAGRGTGASPVKWVRGDGFPAACVCQHAFGQQANTCSHRRGCPRDNNQGRGCTQAHTCMCVYSLHWLC